MLSVFDKTIYLCTITDQGRKCNDCKTRRFTHAFGNSKAWRRVNLFCCIVHRKRSNIRKVYGWVRYNNSGRAEKGATNGCEKRALFDDIVICDNRHFKNNLATVYAADVKFHHTNKPYWNRLETKLYYSDKYNLYGFKADVSIAFNDLAVHACKPYPSEQTYVSFVKKNRPIWIWRTCHPTKATLATMKMEVDLWVTFWCRICRWLRDIRAFIWGKNKQPRRPLSTAEKMPILILAQTESFLRAGLAGSFTCEE